MLKVEGLHAGYGKLEVVHGVSVEVAEGSIVTVVGAPRPPPARGWKGY